MASIFFTLSSFFSFKSYFSSKYFLIERLTGCVEAQSIEYKRFNLWIFSSKIFIFATFNSPLVKVPVLSKTTVFATAKDSINFASLNSKPFFASSEIPTKLAIGVASAKAHGQAITITETATINDLSNCVVPL